MLLLHFTTFLKKCFACISHFLLETLKNRLIYIYARGTCSAKQPKPTATFLQYNHGNVQPRPHPEAIISNFLVLDYQKC